MTDRTIADLLDDDGIERRIAPRKAMWLRTKAVSLRNANESILVHNVSETGALLECEGLYRPEDSLNIELPEVGLLSMKVVWTSGRFLGCEFEHPLSQSLIHSLPLSDAEMVSSSDCDAFPISSDAKAFADRLKRLRKSRGLTQAQLAEVLDVSMPAISAWEKGRSRPRDGRLRALAEILNVPLHELLEEDSMGDTPDTLERCRLKIAKAVGTTPDKVRILIEI